MPKTRKSEPKIDDELSRDLNPEESEGDGETMDAEVRMEAFELEEPNSSEEQDGDLDQELQECQEKANEYLEGWQRSRAEFANYKKRMEREQAHVYQTAAGNIFKRQLVVLDDLDRALSNRPGGGDGAAWSEGIELVYRKLVNILESEGVRVMQVEGEMFDPTLHEAISSEENPDFESGQIIEVLQKGYLMGDRVLRPALVRVAR